ncbi:hypothetical protein [Amycolatopsis sp. DSM 110486]|uniref:hypothetical protein n=1 Tax=Amycolatopsis sp. DSM 110486 TaxID=2865832 RepID=UPI001C699EF2|nr:hypothetical protein [Amycolatopsis sp. DSM 110486]QYN17612.1 hypothetical protein K1T34_33035 [Amycolatopsis sp. DSM 110486]
MAVKTFKVAARRAGSGAKKKTNEPFKLTGDTTVYHLNSSTSEDALAILSAEFAQAEDSKDGVKLTATFLELIQAMFTEDTYRALTAKIRAGQLTFDELTPVIEWGIEELSGRPTTSQSA